PGNEVVALIDGVTAMRAIYDALMDATKYVYVADWQMITTIALVREPKIQETSRVINVLGALAQTRKIDVRVILYKSTFKVPLGDGEALKALRKRGIKCFSHRPGYTLSNHQKLVVVDGRIAFVGGIDLTNGRWDTHLHPVLDETGVHEGD